MFINTDFRNSGHTYNNKIEHISAFQKQQNS